MRPQTWELLALTHLAGQADAAALFWAARYALAAEGVPAGPAAQGTGRGRQAETAARSFVAREAGWRQFCAARGVMDPDGPLAGRPGVDALRRARRELPPHAPPGAEGGAGGYARRLEALAGAWEGGTR